jgi:hypothetical protein
MEMRERQGRRRKQLLDDLKKKRGYWKSKEEQNPNALCKKKKNSL